MATRTVKGLIVLTGAALAVAAVVPLAAQESGAPKASSAGGTDRVRRVPPYFGGLALSAEQRETIYKIREKHLNRIEALHQQIEQEEHQMMVESEAVLTDEQRATLERARARAIGKAVPPKAKEQPKGKA